MLQRTFRGILGGVLIPFITFTSLAQGISFEILHGTGKSEVDKGLYMPGMFRQEEKDGEISILRLDKELMISLYPAQKTYTEMTFAQFKSKIKEGRSKVTDAMKKRMEGMPPEQRKMLEQRMGGVSGQHNEAKTEVVQTGEQKAIDGYRCTGYTLKRNGKVVESIWATKDVPNYASLRKDFQRIASLFTSIGAGRNTFASMEMVDGFPIESSGAGTYEKITKIRPGSFPTSSFEVPPGYTKEKSELEEEVE